MVLFDPEPLEIRKGLPGQMFDGSCKACAIEEATPGSLARCPYRELRPQDFCEDEIYCYCCDDHRDFCRDAYLD